MQAESVLLHDRSGSGIYIIKISCVSYGSSLQLVAFICLFCRGDYTYDDLNRLLQVEYDDGTVIEYVYDEVGNRVQKVNGAGLPDMAGEPLPLVAFVPEGFIRRADILSVWTAGVKGTAGWNV